MPVDGGFRGHVGIDVGDADADANAGRRAVGNLDLIEVSGGVVIDRRPEKIAEVANAISKSGDRLPP